MRFAMVALLLLVLPGCAEPGEADASEEPLTGGEADVPVDEPPRYVDDEDVEGNFALASGPLAAGYAMEVPPHFASSAFAGSSFTYHHLYFKPNNPSTGRMVALFFLDDEPLGGFAWGEHYVLDLEAGTRSPGNDWDATFVRLLDEGQKKLTVVVASDQPNTLRVQFGDEYDPFGDFVMDAEGALDVEAAGRAGSFELHSRSEIVSLTGLALGGTTITEVGSPVVDEAVPFTSSGGARHVTITAACDLGGLSFAYTYWDAIIEDTTVWRHAVSSGDEAISSRGVHSSVYLYDYVATVLTFGLPEGYAIGAGPAEAVLELTGQMVPLRMDTQVVAICFEGTPEELLGTSGQPRAEFGPSLVRLPGEP